MTNMYRGGSRMISEGHVCVCVCVCVWAEGVGVDVIKFPYLLYVFGQTD